MLGDCYAQYQIFGPKSSRYTLVVPASLVLASQVPMFRGCSAEGTARKGTFQS